MFSPVLKKNARPRIMWLLLYSFRFLTSMATLVEWENIFVVTTGAICWYFTIDLLRRRRPTLAFTFHLWFVNSAPIVSYNLKGNGGSFCLGHFPVMAARVAWGVACRVTECLDTSCGCQTTDEVLALKYLFC